MPLTGHSALLGATRLAMLCAEGAGPEHALHALCPYVDLMCYYYVCELLLGCMCELDRVQCATLIMSRTSS